MRDLTTADTMRERAEENRVTLWLLLNANRWLLTAALGAGCFSHWYSGEQLARRRSAR